MHKVLEENEKIDCTHRNALVNGECVLDGGICEGEFPPEPVNIVEERETCSVLV